MKSETIKRLHRLFAPWLPLLPYPLLYLTIVPEIESFQWTLTNEKASVRHACTELLYGFFEDYLSQDHIALASNSANADIERKEIDTIVIHHTSNPPGVRLERLSAIELIRLYAPYFAHPSLQVDRHLTGKPIGSGHLRDGKQVFWPYHWLVRKNGKPERPLYDSEIAWHAGTGRSTVAASRIARDSTPRLPKLNYSLSPTLLDVITFAFRSRGFRVIAR